MPIGIRRKMTVVNTFPLAHGRGCRGPCACAAPTAPPRESVECVAAAVSHTSTTRPATRSATPRRSSGSARSSSRPRGRTSGSAPGRTATSRRSAPTRAGGSSTATTTAGASIATARSSNGCSSLRARCRTSARPPSADLRGRRADARARARRRGPPARPRLLPDRERGICRGERDVRPRDDGEAARAAPARQRDRFDYVAKGGKHRLQSIVDPQVYRLVDELKRRRGGGEDLLAYKERGRWHDILSSEVNEYIKEVTGGDFSAKDFRTWTGTVLAAVAVAVSGPAGVTDGAQPGDHPRRQGGRALPREHARRLSSLIHRSAGLRPVRSGRDDPRRAGRARRRRPRRAGDAGRGRGGCDRAARRLTESRS